MAELPAKDPLAFLGGEDASPIRDLLTWNKKDVPREPGAYILMAPPEVTFRYPWADSSVFYIGQTCKLRSRLNRHRTGIRQAKLSRRLCVYRPRSEYGAKFGAFFSFVLAGPDTAPICLEDRFLALFARHHGSLPVANGAGAWKRIRGIIDAMGCAPHAPPSPLAWTLTASATKLGP